MSPEDRSLRKSMFETYQYSQSNIRRLKANIAPSQVESLATEVIRRLAAKERQLADIPFEPTGAWISDFCTALISHEEDAAAEIVADLRADGVPADIVYLKHIAAAARLLGEWWLDDRATFADVTLASARLFAIMRSLRPLFAPTKTHYDQSAVFASVPGETHTMGIHMATDLLRKEGWDITLKTGLEHDALVGEIEKTDCSIIGLSMSGAHSIDALARLVVALHIACPHVPILVSGSEIETHRVLIDLMGVDGVASDIEEAKTLMTYLLQTDKPRIRQA